MGTTNTKTLTMYIAKDSEGNEIVVPTLEQLAVRRFALERQLEDAEQESDPRLGRLVDDIEDRKAAASKADVPFWNRVLAALSALSTDARRAEITASLTAIDKWERSYKRHVGSKLDTLEKRVYRYHPFTMDERIAARMEAETPDEMTGGVRFDPAVYSREILDRCVENLSDYHEDAGSVPTGLGDALFDAIKSKSEPTLDEIFFIVASLATSETD